MKRQRTPGRLGEHPVQHEGVKMEIRVQRPAGALQHRHAARAAPPHTTPAGALGLDESRVRKAFSQALRRAKLPSFRVYDLRHTYASLLLAQNAPITYVSAQLGHTDATTTLRWYARWIPRTDKRAVDALDDARLVTKLRLEAGQGSATDQFASGTSNRAPRDFRSAR